MDGDYGTVEAVVVVEDANQAMYNLTVAEVHTFVVGEGEWVVHNEDIPTLDIDDFRRNFDTSGMNIVYRNVTPSQHASALTTGIIARNPLNDIPIWQHVVYGHTERVAALSPYLSVTVDLGVATRNQENLPIYAIDLNRVNAPVYDISNAAAQDLYIPRQGIKLDYDIARHSAETNQEMLVHGEIPAAAIVCRIRPK